MAKRTQAWLVEPIPGYENFGRGSASVLAFPSLPTDTFTAPMDTLAAAARMRKAAASLQWSTSRATPRELDAPQSRRASGRSTRAADVQNALYMAGMSFGLVVGTTLGLSIAGYIGL